MKLITWNINGYRAITGQNKKKRYDEILSQNYLFDYIEKENPDIICLQETKASPDQIDEDKLCPPGYHYYYSSCEIKKGYSGVAVFTKIKPKEVNTKIGVDHIDTEGRIIQLDFDDFILFNVYFPNGTSGQKRVDYKLHFYDAFLDYTDELIRKGRNIIISGDYNTAHNEIDLARPKQNINTSGFMPIERERIDRMINTNYVDSFRLYNQEEKQYTWWSQRGRARENNVGWRIDYHFITKGLINDINHASHQPETFGSDHCPVLLDIY